MQVPVGNTFDDMNLTQFEIMPYQINISTLTQYQILPGPFCFDFYYIGSKAQIAVNQRFFNFFLVIKNGPDTYVGKLLKG